MTILAGDIGGTKTVLALFEISDGRPRRIREATFRSGEYASLEAIIGEFLRDEPARSVETACFGVAGPVHAGTVRTTNLPWQLDEQTLAKASGAQRVKLINDLQAAAYGMLFLAPEEFEVLHPGAGQPRVGSAAVIAPGTGLGEAILYRDAGRYHPIGSEGGHADFAPRTEQEIDLLRYLQVKLGPHVSYERVLSGDGIRNIYSFLRDTSGTTEPAWLQQRLAQGDPNAAITQIGLAGEHPWCVATLDLFSSILGAEAGNLALRCLAVGGIVVGGGIAPKMLPALRKGTFVRAFTDKGRFSDWMKAVPVRVALNPQAPLLGAAHFLIDHVIGGSAGT